MNYWLPLGVEHDGNAVYVNTKTGELASEREARFLVALERNVARRIARQIASGREQGHYLCRTSRKR